jgi:MoxR-like ATPase
MTSSSPTTAALCDTVLDEIQRAVVGRRAALRLILTAMLARGHVLIEDLPGLGKTLIARSFAAALGLEFTRVQFTPDLLPADLLGSTIYDMQSGRFDFRRGPIFTNLLLADEINRTPPKTQASLLEVMEERQVSVDGLPRPLPDPFLVAATQNPIEYEGTYPLPEAQLDRFLFKLTVPLPNRDEELGVLRAHHNGFDPRDLAAAGLRPVATASDLAAARYFAQRVQVADVVLAYIVDLCRSTRTAPSLELGASPRGATGLLNAAKAFAWLSGRGYVTPDDVKAVARPALRHRVRLRHEAELEGVTADSVLESLLATVPTPR